MDEKVSALFRRAIENITLDEKSDSYQSLKSIVGVATGLHNLKIAIISCHKENNIYSSNVLFRSLIEHYAKFLISNPIYVLELVSLSILAGNSPYSTYGGTVSILPASFEGIYFGNRNYALRLDNFSAQNIPMEKLRVNAPIVLWFLVFFMIIIFNRSQYSQKSLSQLSPYSKFNYLFVFGFVIIISTAIIVPNEWYRQTIVGQVSIFINDVFPLSTIRTGCGTRTWLSKDRQYTAVALVNDFATPSKANACNADDSRKESILTAQHFTKVVFVYHYCHPIHLVLKLTLSFVEFGFRRGSCHSEC
jgi:hypothetical protein